MLMMDGDDVSCEMLSLSLLICLPSVDGFLRRGIAIVF